MGSFQRGEVYYLPRCSKSQMGVFTLASDEGRVLPVGALASPPESPVSLHVQDLALPFPFLVETRSSPLDATLEGRLRELPNLPPKDCPLLCRPGRHIETRRLKFPTVLRGTKRLGPPIRTIAGRPTLPRPRTTRIPSETLPFPSVPLVVKFLLPAILPRCGKRPGRWRL